MIFPSEKYSRILIVSEKKRVEFEQKHANKDNHNNTN